MSIHSSCERDNQELRLDNQFQDATSWLFTTTLESSLEVCTNWPHLTTPRKILDKYLFYSTNTSGNKLQWKINTAQQINKHSSERFDRCIHGISVTSFRICITQMTKWRNHFTQITVLSSGFSQVEIICMWRALKHAQAYYVSKSKSEWQWNWENTRSRYCILDNK